MRRAVTWRPKQPGDATLDIGDLIRPFRYDVVVRSQLFDRIDTHRPTTVEMDDFALDLLDHPYATWYRDVELARFFPWILRDEDLVRRTFVRRVAQAVSTFESVESRGFDTGHPVTLRRVHLPRLSDSGVPVTHIMHVGDGGHRLALLMRAGLSLAPGMYRVDPRPTTVIDNTALLAPALGLTEEAWVDFVAPHFVRATAGTLDDLQRAVAVECPHREPELHALAAAHLTLRTRL